jgi:peptide-methionine (S)-S-oxide reductase
MTADSTNSRSKAALAPAERPSRTRRRLAWLGGFAVGLGAAGFYAAHATAALANAARAGGAGVADAGSGPGAVPPRSGTLAAPESPAPRGSAATTQEASIVLAGGCFWGVQAVFQHVRGVHAAVSGYAGGAAPSAFYEAVSSGTTGHAESVRVSFDPRQVSLADLLQVFFLVAHDPTERDRQGPDEGTQYRSAVFAASPAQAAEVRQFIAQLEARQVFGAAVATEVTELKGFYPAEASHQDYATRHPQSAYIRRFDLPKVAGLEHQFPALYRADPVLVGAQARSATGP